MLLNVSFNITAKYSFFDAYLYDAIAADEVAKYFSNHFDALTNDYIRKLPASSRILDLGCGGGQIAISLARRFPNLEFFGVDLCEAQIKRANHRLGSLDNLRFDVEDALDLPFDNSTFDAVISIGCIKHCSNKRLGLFESCRILKPGGCLFVCDLDSDLSSDAALKITSTWKMPKFLKPMAANFLQKSVLEKSITDKELENLSKELPLEKTEILKLSESFFVGLSGLKIVK